jgi:carbonic anhydrase/acetyltransferase-like protein (isoleucine patch superfamily)
MPIYPFQGIWPTIASDVFIAPGAMIIGDVTIEEGASIWYNAVVRGDTAPIVIGRHSNIQDNCTLHTDADAPLTIGAECTIGHNVVLHGATLEDHILVGMNAVVLSHARVGASSIIGACALVSEHKCIAGGSLVVGIPARVVRALSPAEQASIADSASGYYERAKAHKDSSSSGNET